MAQAEPALTQIFASCNILIIFCVGMPGMERERMRVREGKLETMDE